MSTPTRWGILGTGAISNEFCTCLNSLPDSEHVISAVAARSKEKADKFAADFNIPHTHTTYTDLINDPDIDIVYISTIHINHVELSLECIDAGKNVLCEKPMSLTLDGCKKVLAAAKEKNVLFVEGFWTRFFPVYHFVMEQIESGALGEIHSMQATFAQPIMKIARVFKKELGGGGLMDIGCYPIQAANMVFKGKPEKITAHGTLTEAGVDRHGFITLRYPGNKFANLIYDTETSDGGNSFVVRGTKGNLIVPDTMWSPDRVVKQDGEIQFFQLPTVKEQERLRFTNTQGFCYQIQAVRDCLLKGLKESPDIPHEDSETIQYIISEVQKQLGLSYDFL